MFSRICRPAYHDQTAHLQIPWWVFSGSSLSLQNPGVSMWETALQANAITALISPLFAWCKRLCEMKGKHILGFGTLNFSEAWFWEELRLRLRGRTFKWQHWPKQFPHFIAPNHKHIFVLCLQLHHHNFLTWVCFWSGSFLGCPKSYPGGGGGGWKKSHWTWDLFMPILLLIKTKRKKKQ